VLHLARLAGGAAGAARVALVDRVAGLEVRGDEDLVSRR
jgi:hypothetical protein